MRLAVLPRTLPRDPVEIVLTGLHESHDVSAYEAVERLLYTAQAAGVDTQALLRMLDQGIAFQNVLDLIISKAKSSQKAA
jgi:hypothetical protein